MVISSFNFVSGSSKDALSTSLPTDSEEENIKPKFTDFQQSAKLPQLS